MSFCAERERNGDSGRANAMAIVGFVSLVVVAVLTVQGCAKGDQTLSASGTSTPGADTTRAQTGLGAARDMVLRARAFDRADQLDSARVQYAEAARRAPVVSDWLYLRAAGVSTERSTRDDYLDEIETPVARDRRGVTAALALERAGDIDGAIAAYTASDERLAALRLGLARPADSMRVAATRRGLAAFLRSGAAREDLRDAIALFDKTFLQRSPVEELAVARAAYTAGMAERAVTGFKRAFAGAQGTARDRFSAGMMLARLNRDSEAAAEYARIPASDALGAAARYQRARALLALGRREDARSALRQLTTSHAADTSAASALLLLSDLATDDLRDADARATLLTVVQRFPRSRHAPVARFRAGLIAYIRGDYRAASQELDSVVALHPSSADALASGYWSGRAWKQRGDSGAANSRWRAVIAREPASYYSVLGAKRLGVTIIGDSSRTASRYPAVADIDEAMKRVAVLRDFGMDTEAKFEYDRLFRDASKNPERLVATAHALAGTDQASRSIALGIRAVNEAGRTAQNYRLMYPVMERGTLIESSRANGLDPILVASLIRQESSFNPRATSPVGARGLMQLMPSVGRTLARSRGVQGYTDESLYDPAVSIRLGTTHLGALFRGSSGLERVLAAYNAGESRVVRWSNKAGTSDPEVFTERIPFVETRDYVRIIVRNRAFYGALYQW